MLEKQKEYQILEKKEEEDWAKQLEELENKSLDELVKELPVTFVGDSVMLGAMNNLKKAFPNSYNYVAKRNNYIYWNPNYSCGNSSVYIENQATAALYIYTTYRPNQAALNNLYGSGDGCSSYGNRNFWRIFTDWFGSTQSLSVQPNLQNRYAALGGLSSYLG